MPYYSRLEVVGHSLLEKIKSDLEPQVSKVLFGRWVKSSCSHTPLVYSSTKENTSVYLVPQNLTLILGRCSGRKSALAMAVMSQIRFYFYY